MKNNIFFQAFLVLMLTIGLSACGGSEDSSDSASETNQSTTTSDGDNDVADGSDNGNSGNTDTAASDYEGEETPTPVFNFTVAEAEKGNWAVFYNRIAPDSRAQMDEMLNMISAMAALDPELSAQVSGKEGGELFSAIMSANPEMQAQIGFNDVTVLSEVIADDGASATLSIEYPENGTMQQENVPMVQVDGKWYFVME